MKKLKKEQGITLIALIITIIVLLILALVTINSITGDGDLISYANNAGSKYTAEGKNENAVVQNYLDIIESMNKVKVYTATAYGDEFYVNLEQNKIFCLDIDGIGAYYSEFIDEGHTLKDAVKDENEQVIIPAGEKIWTTYGSLFLIKYNNKIYIEYEDGYKEMQITEIDKSMLDQCIDFKYYQGE